MPNYSKRAILIDGHAIIYRAYHAFPSLTSAEGQLVNAVYGFSRLLLTVIRDFHPHYIAVTSDHQAKTKRSEQYVEYKAHRPPMPDDLRPQIEIIKEFVDTLSIPRFELAGYEADDLIGTISKQIEAEHPDIPVLIVTGDKDLLQLVTDQTHVFIPGRGKFSKDIEYDPATVLAKLKITPEQVIDYKALRGDTSDNIPGVAGIGEKTAVRLIQKYQTVEAVLDAAQNGGESELIKGALLRKLQEGKSLALLSQELARVQRDVPIEFSLQNCVVSNYDKTAAVDFCKRFEFRSLVSLLPKDLFEQQVQASLF